MEKGYPVVVNNKAVPVKTSYAATPLSISDIMEQNGVAVSGPIGSGYYTGVATGVNVNLIQGNAGSVGGMNLYVKYITITSNKAAMFLIRINQGAGFLGTVPATADRIFPVTIGTNQTITVPIMADIVWGAKINLFVEKFLDATGTAEIRFYHDSRKHFQCTNPFAKHILLGVGDSIMEGVGTSFLGTQPYLSHFALLYKYYRNLGYDVVGINRGIPGATIEDIVVHVRAGYYNIKNVKVIKLSIGTNVSPSDASFTASLNEILDYFQEEPFENTIKIIEGPQKRLDIKELNLVNYRAIMSAAVAARQVNDPTMFYLDLTEAFVASDPIYGLIPGVYETGEGGNVHYNDLGHKKVHDLEKSFCIAHNIYPE